MGQLMDEMRTLPCTNEQKKLDKIIASQLEWATDILCLTIESFTMTQYTH